MRAATALFLVGCASRAPAPRPTKTDSSAESKADAIVAKVNRRYATATTYRDDGTYRDSFRDLDGTLKQTRTGRFRTRWRAPDRMLFQLDDDAQRRLAVWASSDGTARQLLGGRVVECASLDQCLTAMQGVTHGLTALVPRWLVDRGSRGDVRYVSRGEVGCGEHRCVRLERAREDGKGTVALLVDVATFALRGFESHSKLGEGNAAFILDDEVMITPTFDEPLPDYELAFDPAMASSLPDRPAR